jgi:hypothetical protein
MAHFKQIGDVGKILASDNLKIRHRMPLKSRDSYATPEGGCRKSIPAEV